MKEQKRGISLIVLVITIIVMVILATAIMISLNNAGVINNANKAVGDTNIKQVQTMASIAWSDAYNEATVANKNSATYFDTKVKETLRKNNVDLSKYIITTSTKGVTLSGLTDSLSTSVDGVPIPKGFVASSATGENTKAGGLVIYEGTEAVTDTNVTTAKTTRNQYVWIPVEDFNDFAKGNIECIALDGEIIERTPSATPGQEGEFEIQLGKDNIPIINQNPEYTTRNTENEAIALYKSIKKYGGFYVARYEAGTDIPRVNKNIQTGNEVKSMQNKYVYNIISWSNDIGDLTCDSGGAVEVARSVYPNNENNTTGVCSNLIYNSEWRQIIKWLASSNIPRTIDVRDTEKPGNFYTTAFELEDFVEGAKFIKSKDITDDANSFNGYKTITTGKLSASSESDKDNQWLLTTGATDKTKTKNIYDLLGNVYEFSMLMVKKEDKYYRGLNGGWFGSKLPIMASLSITNSKQYAGNFGFRVALYIK